MGAVDGVAGFATAFFAAGAASLSLSLDSSSLLLSLALDFWGAAALADAFGVAFSGDDFAATGLA